MPRHVDPASLCHTQIFGSDFTEYQKAASPAVLPFTAYNRNTSLTEEEIATMLVSVDGAPTGKHTSGGCALCKETKAIAKTNAARS